MNALLLAAFGWLSRGAITPSIATNNTADAVGIALTPQAPGLGGIGHLDRFGLQLALALKDQVIQRRHANQRALSYSATRKWIPHPSVEGGIRMIMSLN